MKNSVALSGRLGASNSCINPLLYTFFNRKYKNGFVGLLRYGFCCKLGPPGSLESSSIQQTGLTQTQTQTQVQLQSLANNQTGAPGEVNSTGTISAATTMIANSPTKTAVNGELGAGKALTKGRKSREPSAVGPLDSPVSDGSTGTVKVNAPAEGTGPVGAPRQPASAQRLNGGSSLPGRRRKRCLSKTSPGHRSTRFSNASPSIITPSSSTSSPSSSPPSSPSPQSARGPARSSLQMGALP